jgi:hypothetical protein
MIELDITLPLHQPLVNLFEWRDASGKFHKIKDMETTHLFNILKMIWNHSVPEILKILPYKNYTFSEFYTNNYMRTAVRNITSELFQRVDLKYNQIEDLNNIRNIILNGY